MDHLRLSHERLNVEEITELVKSASCGAVSVFIGTTRDNFEGKTVVTLEYEAYESMALKGLKEICSNIREQWPSVEHVAIYHRWLGVLLFLFSEINTLFVDWGRFLLKKRVSLLQSHRHTD